MAAFQFYEAQRIIVMDAVRTDLRRSPSTSDATATPSPSPPSSDSTADSQASASVLREDDWCSDYWVSTLARHQLEHTPHFDAEQKRQVLRLVNLLSAYAVHDPETGYCQGMSDLAIPFLMLTDNDAMAFMCFQRLMQKVRRNFAIEDSGIFAQLASLARLLEQLDPTLFYKIRQMGATGCHFAYRMIVVQLRREVALDQALQLWEMVWADDLLRLNSAQSDLPLSSDDVAAAARTTTHSPAVVKTKPSQQAADSSRSPIKPSQQAADSARSPIKPSQQAANSARSSTKPSQQATDSAQSPIKPSQQAADSAQSPMKPSQLAFDSSGNGATPLRTLSDVSSTLSSVAHTTSTELTQRASPVSGEEYSPTSRGASVADKGSGVAHQLLSGPHFSGIPCLPTSNGVDLDSATNPSDIFSYFVAAVVISQRRRILDHCHDSDDVLTLFHALRKVDVKDCMARARQYRSCLSAGP
eukprot:gene13603-19476_t